MTHDGKPHGLCAVADLTDPGQALELMTGSDVVVHLAAIPAPGIRSEAETFRINALSTYNVFAAAVAAAGSSRWSGHRARRSSAFPFDTPPRCSCRSTRPSSPGPRPRTPSPSSSVKKIALQLSRRSGTPLSSGYGSPTSWSQTTISVFPGFWDDARLRKWNLWGYVDVRDVAYAIRLGLDAQTLERLRYRHRGCGRHGDAPELGRPHVRGLPGGSAPSSGGAGGRPCSRSTTPW